MEMRHLRYFCAAAEEGSVSGAARRLFVSQPAVSRLIKDMETELGTPLFLREQRGLSLTCAGNRFLGYARTILGMFDEAVQAVSENTNAATTVNIGFIAASLTSFVAPMLRHLAVACPGVVIIPHELPPGEQLERLRRRTLDIALIGTPCGWVADEFALFTLRELPQQGILSGRHRLAERGDIGLDELRGEALIGFDEKLFPGRNQFMQQMFAQTDFIPRFGAQAQSLVALMGMVGSGLGFCIVPNEVASLPHPGVVFLPIRDTIAPELFTAVWRRDDARPVIRDLLRALQTVPAQEMDR